MQARGRGLDTPRLRRDLEGVIPAKQQFIELFHMSQPLFGCDSNLARQRYFATGLTRKFQFIGVITADFD